MKYLPFINGAYSVAPGLIRSAERILPHNNLCLHIDEDYLRYIANKEECRKENLEKYHPGFQVADEMMKPLLDFLLEKMIAENPDSFEIFEGDKFKGLYNLITNEIIQWHPATNKISGNKTMTDTSLEYKGLTGKKEVLKKKILDS